MDTIFAFSVILNVMLTIGFYNAIKSFKELNSYINNLKNQVGIK